ncbi:MAG: shikimate synthase, partial [Bdellovibrionales bacterium]|nr:shikimate synthase [Bdellovibrionales bacterium]
QLIDDYRLRCFDWALELGPPINGLKPQILSIHSFGSEEKDFSQNLGSLSAQYPDVPLIKVAVITQNFEDLEFGHSWFSQDPSRRVFLPMSESGRWNWYRLLMKSASPLQFFRENEGSANDQPTLFDWLRVGDEMRPFAAVLGHPVKHSRTPGEHFEVFKANGLNTFAIDIAPEEFSERTMRFLKSLGLRFAAVTAPLKNLAVGHCTQLTPEARTLGSVNTLAIKGDDCVGHNTDLPGFRESVQKSAVDLSAPIVLWGGVGTLPVVKSVLPQAIAFSARSGKPRDESEFLGKPKTLVWAVGQGLMSESQFPHPSWKPDLVLDLNYAEDSPGREYAIRVGAKYVSGLGMFQKQAEEQQKFWRPYVGK